MVLPLIAAGVVAAVESEAVLAAGATATAFLYAKRREIAAGLVHAAHATGHLISQTIEVVTGTDDAPPLPPLELIKVGQGGGNFEPPQDPEKWRRLVEGIKESAGKIKAGAEKIAQNPLVQGAYKLYRIQTYALAAVATAEIARRMITGSKDHGPILYDYLYAPLLGESVAARTMLGGQQLMAEETTAGMLAVTLAKAVAPKYLSAWLDVPKFVSHLPTFLPINAYAALGNWSFIEHQIVANNTAAQNVDFDRASRTAGLFGFTSIAFFPIKDWLINLPVFGRIGFREWWMRWGAAEVPTLQRALTSTEGLNWLGAQAYRGAELFLGHRIAASLAPHYIPRLQTIAVYALFATAYRNVAQAIASLPFFEDSDMGQSLAFTNVRSAASTLLFDPYLYLGSRSNSLRSIFGNQLVFMGLVYYLDQFYSSFDGKDVAVAEADRALKAAFSKGSKALLQAAASKPLTERNFSVPPQTDLSVKTWAELTRQYTQDATVSPVYKEALAAAMRSHLKSSEPGEHRVGLALQVMLSGKSRNKAQLEYLFEGIKRGLYDEAPIF